MSTTQGTHAEHLLAAREGLGGGGRRNPTSTCLCQAADGDETEG